MKSEKDLAIVVLRANTPPNALTIPNEPIAYWAEGRVVHAYKFTARGQLRIEVAPAEQAGIGHAAFRAWGKRWVVPAPIDGPRVSIPLTGVVVPDEVQRGSRNAAAARYARRQMVAYIAAHKPDGYEIHPAVPHVAVRRLGAHLEVWRVSQGKVSGQAFYKDRDGVRITRHPIINGSAIVDGVELTLVEGTITQAVAVAASRAYSVPARVSEPDEIADLRFNDTEVPEGYRVVPGLRAWYKPIWRDANGRIEIGLELRWGFGVAAAVELYGIDPSGDLSVSGKRYKLTQDFKLSAPPVL